MFCPSCARPAFENTEAMRYACAACGFTFYRNVAAAVTVVIRCQGRVLFAVRANDPGKGMLDFPGGFVDPGETLERAATRELKEELSLDPPELRYLFSEPNRYPFREVVYRTVDTFFEVRFDSEPAVRPGDDVAGTVWMPLSEVRPAEIALPSIRRGVQRLRQIGDPLTIPAKFGKGQCGRSGPDS